MRYQKTPFTGAAGGVTMALVAASLTPASGPALPGGIDASPAPTLHHGDVGGPEGVDLGAPFSGAGVQLMSWISVDDFGPGISNGNDCWGYVSPSGREYALMCLADRLGVVDITDPSNPVIVATPTHPDSPWGDVKAYNGHAYVVNETGGGVQVLDLSQVDSGVVTEVGFVTAGGVQSVHNIAIDEHSGYAYVCGANAANGGLVIYDLSNPASPQHAGQWNGLYVHDLQAVTYTQGPYAGRQIAFCFTGGEGVYIIDVTDKSDPQVLSTLTYSGLGYTHQGWLSDDRTLLYVNDELDEWFGFRPTTTTRVVDVTDLEAPLLVGEFTSGRPTIDHNLYVHGNVVFEANYESGVRIFDARDPADRLDPPQVGWFDTHPDSEEVSFDGAWSVYPYYPSGRIIVSDVNRGLFVLDPTVALFGAPLTIEVEGGPPALLDPLGQTLRVVIQEANGGALEPGSPTLHLHDHDTESDFEIPLTMVGPGVFEAAVPALPCGHELEYYVEAFSATGLSVTDPPGAPTNRHEAIVGVAGDFNADCRVGGTDLGILLGSWGPAGGVADIDGDGDVDGMDLAFLLGQWR